MPAIIPGIHTRPSDFIMSRRGSKLAYTALWTWGATVTAGSAPSAKPASDLTHMRRDVCTETLRGLGAGVHGIGDDHAAHRNEHGDTWFERAGRQHGGDHRARAYKDGPEGKQ